MTKKAEPQDKNLNIRISKRLLNGIGRASRKAGVTASDWIRKGLDKLVEQELKK